MPNRFDFAELLQSYVESMIYNYVYHVLLHGFGIKFISGKDSNL